VDLELAKAEADKVEDDEELRKKLWLKVAKHVIEQEKGVEREYKEGNRILFRDQ
jgi:vacuolar protein sorting-associated protein 18